MEIIREIKGEPITDASDVYKYLSEFKNQDREHLIVIGLDTKNQPCYREIASIGTLGEMYVHPREIFKKAIIMSCASIIIAHNHPSGDTNPSAEDKAFTRKLVSAGKLLGIQVLDHVIIGDSYFSFNNEGILED